MGDDDMLTCGFAVRQLPPMRSIGFERNLTDLCKQIVLTLRQEQDLILAQGAQRRVEPVH